MASLLTHYRIPSLCTILLAFLFAPPAALAQERQTIVVTGSSTIAPLIVDIAHRYEEANPQVVVDVQTGGSSRGMSDVRRRVADIGMVSRALLPDEADVKATLIGRDGIAILVHKTNPVSSLTDEQVRGIYRSELSNWKDVGGHDSAITIVNKAEGRSTLDVFLGYVKLANKDVRAHVVVGDNEQGIKVLLGNPRSIGYVSVGTAEHHIAEGAPLKMIGLGEVAPSTGSIASGAYAASRELNLVTFQTVPAHVADFLTFATSETNHDLVRDYYFVPPTK